VSGSKKKGIVVDPKDPRKAMIDAGWGGKNPDRRKRKKKGPPSWVEKIRKGLGV
jgi:hypothetical protein